MDLLVTFDNGMIVIEDMSRKARAGLRRENDIKSMFYFFNGDYTITEKEESYLIVGDRKGLFAIPEKKIIPRDIVDAHHIPTKRLRKAIRNPLDIFRTKPSCYMADDRMVIPLTEIHKHVTIEIPKNIAVRLKQGEWFFDEEENEVAPEGLVDAKKTTSPKS